MWKQDEQDDAGPTSGPFGALGVKVRKEASLQVSPKHNGVATEELMILVTKVD